MYVPFNHEAMVRAYKWDSMGGVRISLEAQETSL